MVTAETEPNLESTLSLSSDISCLRKEVSLLRDQLSRAVSLIESYETKLAGYSSSVEVLNDRFNKREACYLSAVVAPGQSQPENALPVKVHVPSNTLKPTLKQKMSKKNTQIPPRPAVPMRGPGKTILPETVPEDTGSVSVEVLSLPCSAVQNQHHHHQDAEDMQQWTEVRRNRRPTSLCGTAGPAVTSLKAVEPRTYIHLWNMESCADEIRNYLRELCPNESCTVVELPTKGDYKSYKIGVPVAYHETCLSPEVWPVNARIKTWIVYSRRPTTEGVPGKPNQPFRAGAAAR